FVRRRGDGRSRHRRHAEERRECAPRDRRAREETPRSEKEPRARRPSGRGDDGAESDSTAHEGEARVAASTVNPLLVVGSIAFDDLEMPTGNHPDVLGGAATYSSIAASLLAPVRLVGVVGTDFPETHLEMQVGRASC